jgi:hypothetical protein
MNHQHPSSAVWRTIDELRDALEDACVGLSQHVAALLHLARMDHKGRQQQAFDELNHFVAAAIDVSAAGVRAIAEH